MRVVFFHAAAADFLHLTLACCQARAAVLARERNAQQYTYRIHSEVGSWLVSCGLLPRNMYKNKNTRRHRQTQTRADRQERQSTYMTHNAHSTRQTRACLDRSSPGRVSMFVASKNHEHPSKPLLIELVPPGFEHQSFCCLLYTSDAADE